jgi:hypothetical protein
MDWPRILAYITGTVDQELLLRNEYLVAENRILRQQVNGRLLLSDSEKKTLAEIGYRLGRKALEDVANAAKLQSRTRSSVGTGNWWPRSSMVPRHAERLADLK